jgi:preprotein translocase subunit SecG
MELVILVIHIFLALAIIATVLIQPAESSSLGGLGASNTMAGTTGRGHGNLLTRTTAILATGFIITSLILAVLSGHHDTRTSILDKEVTAPAMQPAKATDDAAKAKTETIPPQPPAKTAPSVPLTQ